jgi:hypothetical protein
VSTVLLGGGYRVTVRSPDRNRTCLRSSSIGGDGSGDACLAVQSEGAWRLWLPAWSVESLYEFSDAMARVCDASTFVMAVDVLVLVLHCLAVQFEGAWRL